MKLRNWLGCGIMLAASMPATVAPRYLPSAHADVYYAVEPGETLATIAAHYKTRADLLRTINNLPAVKDNDVLGSMLLRIPEAASGAALAAPTGSAIAAAPAKSGVSDAANSSANEAQPVGFGTITSAVGYKVLAGDTVASIAATYLRQGYPVSADAIRNRNHLTGEPAVGSQLIVPLQSATYRSVAAEPATGHPANAAPSPEGAVSDEVPATVIEQPDPVYKAPNAPRQTLHGSNLPSRGYYPGATGRDGVRVLSPNEDAPNSAPSSELPSYERPDHSPSHSLAEVAEVSENGARIRRLPMAVAVTLYHCPLGTQLAVIREQADWSAVLMSDRSTGWIPTHYLRRTGGSVDVGSISLSESNWTEHPTNQSYYSNGYTSSSQTVAQALRWLGTPYEYGGTGRNGIDCSSLVQHAFAACGYHLPRTAAEQAQVGSPVDPANLQAGDRLYFSASGTRIDHTGLYMGNGLFVQASGHAHSVVVSSLYEPRCWNIFVGARR